MTALFINGSPRNDGNSALLLKSVLQGIKAVDSSIVVKWIELGAITTVPCIACDGCARSGICIKDDDMTAIYRAVDLSDIIVVASPIYFCSVTAQLKAVIDRFHSVWVNRFKLGKAPAKIRYGIFLAVAASDKTAYFRNSREIVGSFFKTVGAEYSGDIFAGNIEKRGDIDSRPEALASAMDLGRNVASSVIGKEKI